MVHGNIDALGFRFGKLAYASDVSLMPDEAKAVLYDLEVLIVDALRYTRHPSHFNLEQALALIEEVAPQRAVLTNLHTDLDYATLRRQVPPHVEPAYDGMTITVSD
jgi:phosphoribosyl 1,2-cyclic phosphate phosphodiesterase